MFTLPADPAICLAAAQGAHRCGGSGEAREPHADWRVQCARRDRLFRPVETSAPAGARDRHRNAWQSLAFAGARVGVAVSIVVPRGNSIEKNAAMHSLGAELIEYGRDFDEAKDQAVRIAAERGLEFAPSFHRDFVV